MKRKIVATVRNSVRVDKDTIYKRLLNCLKVDYKENVKEVKQSSYDQ